ncbi:MAG: hypothetical protein N2234_06425, partial [Planctomycetota bacterium]|nr:hypothetical protein [Planctomycetota bacterium]
MELICKSEPLFVEAIIPVLKTILPEEEVVFSIANFPPQIPADSFVIHLLGFLPENEEKRRIKTIRKKGYISFFIAPSLYHSAMVPSEETIFLPQVSFIRADSFDEENDFIELNDVSSPYIFAFPYISTMKEIETLIAAFSIASPRFGKELSLALALFDTPRHTYEGILKLADKHSALEWVQPLFVEKVSDIAALIKNANGYLSAPFEGVY